MCTVVVWDKEKNGQATLVSRNMDWFSTMETQMWVIPAGRSHKGSVDSNPLTWTSKYGSVVLSTYNIGVPDGVNEKGLAGHMLWLSDSTFGKRDLTYPGLGVSLWVQYYLDNFATVAEAVADYEARPYQVTLAEVAGRGATVHLQISDALGDVAVLELDQGQVKITHGSQYSVLTNQPTFDQQLANLKNYLGFGGDKTLPGTVNPEDRFVRASYYSKYLPKAATLDKAKADLMSVLANTAQPYSEPADPNEPSVAPTIWRTTTDQTNLTYMYETTSTPYLVWLDLKNLDFTPGTSVKRLPLEEMTDKIGEVSSYLQDADLFTYTLPASS